MKKKLIKKVILAYSGGLDTSVIIPWLKENYKCEVIAFVADIGQNKEDLNNIEDKALMSGASSCYILDLKEEFISNYVFPILKVGALYESDYLLGTAIARPLIAKAQVDLANKLNADALCHGSTGKGNDQIRFEVSYASLDSRLTVLAPWREWNLNSREDLLKYLSDRNIPTSTTLKKIYSRDENAFHISTEGGILEDTHNATNKDCWVWTKELEDTPDVSEKISITFNKGIISSINGINLSPFNCIDKLNKIGSIHGIGRVDIVENRLIGIKSRGCYETPGGTIIFKSLRSLEQIVFDRECLRWREKLGAEMSNIVYDGKWFSPIREAIQSSSDFLSNLLNGEIVLKLYKGNIIVLQKKSPNSLYSKEYATFNNDSVYNHKDATGFIRLFSLSDKIRSSMK
ncbi:argininosuccinate synthase [Buchnera aphidicola (Neophyllaphis podocarpi)]|uniref:argininosuccinate synthase n=1 Tax=Buchnera aphidicola TaxID=9 RepID=UPI0031B81927